MRRALIIVAMAMATMGSALPAHAQVADPIRSTPHGSIAWIPRVAAFPTIDLPASLTDDPPKPYVPPKTDPPTSEDCRSRGGTAYKNKYGALECKGGDLDGRGLKPGVGGSLRR
jgi:hypothetical protein